MNIPRYFYFALHYIWQSASTLSNVIYNIAKHPEIQEKLYQEVVTAVQSDGNMTDSDLKKMPYLKACIKESFRWECLLRFFCFSNDNNDWQTYNFPITKCFCFTMFT